MALERKEDRVGEKALSILLSMAATVENIQYTLHICQLYALQFTDSKLCWVKGNIRKASQRMEQASINIHIHFILRAHSMCPGMKEH